MRKLDQHYGSLNGRASVIDILAHSELLAKRFYLGRDCKDFIAYRLCLLGIFRPTDFVPKRATLLTQCLNLRINLQRVLNKIVLRFKSVLAEKLRLLRVHTGAANIILDGGIGFGIFGNDLRYRTEQVEIVEI